MHFLKTGYKFAQFQQRFSETPNRSIIIPSECLCRPQRLICCRFGRMIEKMHFPLLLETMSNLSSYIVVFKKEDAHAEATDSLIASLTSEVESQGNYLILWFHGFPLTGVALRRSDRSSVHPQVHARLLRSIRSSYAQEIGRTSCGQLRRTGLHRQRMRAFLGHLFSSRSLAMYSG